MKRTMLCAALVGAFHLSDARAVVIETVTVGSPGNLPDPMFYPKNNPQQRRFGAVPYAYRIGRTEVTYSQYVEFLNAVAATDTHDLFNSYFSPSDNSYGMVRSGVSGSYRYSVKENMGNKPVGAVSLWDAMRFVNWLHNGQPSGAQDETTTEDGAYPLNGVTSPDSDSNVVRRASATWFIPTENEWFKAAYYHPASENLGASVALSGAEGPGAGGYFRYPTSSDADPVAATANSTGDVNNSGANVATYSWQASWNGVNGHVTSVGSALSASPFGTYDQGGNVTEWTETIVYTPPLQYAVRGGHSQSTFVSDLSTEDRGVLTGSDHYITQGFRVAAVIPEPASTSMALIALLISCARCRSKRPAVRRTGAETLLITL